jgi:predicted acyltransferase
MKGMDSTTQPRPVAVRLVSLDAFRGAIMLLMASGGLAIPRIAEAFPESRIWQIMGVHTEHAAWAGCTLWDLIQPAFMFMVGVALPWSIANRRNRGETLWQSWRHALMRSLVLVLLAVFLSSAWSQQTEWVFPNVLAQIGLGYPVLFLVAHGRTWMQWSAAFLILIVYGLAFAWYPVAPADFDWSSVGVTEDWPHLTGFAAHWDKNYNFAARFDQWFLNLFPREDVFVFNRGGYQTLNFVPSIATMIFGLLAGQMMRDSTSMWNKVRWLLVFGLMGLLSGVVLEQAGICPIVKRIWTPSWTLFSAGWVCWLMAFFVVLIECLHLKKWAFPFVVAGLNPITLYCMWQLSAGFVRDNLKRHINPDIFLWMGETYEPMLQRGLVLVVLWLVLYWMYRRKIFIRV